MLGWRNERVSDRTAEFERLVLGELDRSYRLAAVILGSAIEAEDAVSDAALRAWRSRSALREPDRFEAWFSRIIINVCRDRLRRRRRTPVVEVFPEPPSDQAAPGDFRDAIHARDELDRALGSLPVDDRIVLALRFWADLPVDAIADRLGIPSGTVKSRLHRALDRLRDAIAAKASS